MVLKLKTPKETTQVKILKRALKSPRPKALTKRPPRVTRPKRALKR